MNDLGGTAEKDPSTSADAREEEKKQGVFLFGLTPVPRHPKTSAVRHRIRSTSFATVDCT